jgi:hypothetical protein
LMASTVDTTVYCEDTPGKGKLGSECRLNEICILSCSYSNPKNTTTYTVRVCLPGTGSTTCTYEALWDENVHHRW